MRQEIQLTTTDHISVAIHALFIFLALKLAFTNNTVLSIFGWMLAYGNLLSFDTYGLWRKNGARKR